MYQESPTLSSHPPTTKQYAPHSEKSPPSYPQSPLPWIKGLKWGEYVGSPCTPDPVVCFSQPHGERFGSLLALPTRAICGLSHKFCLMMIYSKEQGRDPLSRLHSLSYRDPPADSINSALLGA